jgi:hypothetical protein
MHEGSKISDAQHLLNELSCEEASKLGEAVSMNWL